MQRAGPFGDLGGRVSHSRSSPEWWDGSEDAHRARQRRLPCGETMKTFVYHLAEKTPGRREMERFAHPIHVGIVSADDVLAAYSLVVDDLRPTFAER